MHLRGLSVKIMDSNDNEAAMRMLQNFGKAHADVKEIRDLISSVNTDEEFGEVEERLDRLHSWLESPSAQYYDS